ncbi:bacillithiol system redox-active protein YtxJ [Neobacillus sp. D3-1R]|uniref:bacillithiol system redox-active protein YtxJ n=1 Tax=Neobacillus sp. D3-1R TaxID=3445778 RepID=UPI003F9EECAB
MKQINNETQLTEALNNEGLVFVLKHSTTCPISQAAFEEYQKFSQEHPELDCYFLTVQDARPLSSYIAEQYHIKHESPQAILFKKKDVNWHASHWKITNSSLSTVLKENA